MSIEAFLVTFISSVSGGGLLAAAVVWLSKNWITERLKQSIQHEYDQKLSHLNTELKMQADNNALTLKAAFEKEAERLRFATSSISATQRIAIERKLDAIDTLWECILLARQNVPPVMGFIDILTVDEYVANKDHPQFKQLVGELSVDKLAAMFQDNVGSKERVRPYIGEPLWALLATYQALIVRVALLLHWGTEDEEKLKWHLRKLPRISDR